MPVSFKGIEYHSTIQYNPASPDKNTILGKLSQQKTHIYEEWRHRKLENTHVFTTTRKFPDYDDILVDFYVADGEDGKYLNKIKELATSKLPPRSPLYEEPTFERGSKLLTAELERLYNLAKTVILTKVR